MNHITYASVAVLFSVSIASGIAEAAFSEDGATPATSIEAPGRALDLLDRLTGDTHPDLFKTVLQQHAGASQSTKNLMEGHFEPEGAPEAFIGQALFGQAYGRQASPDTFQAAPPDLARLTVARSTGYGGSSDSSPAMPSPSVASGSGRVTVADATTPVPPVTPPPEIYTLFGTDTPPPEIYTLFGSDNTPVPLPAAGILLASGLLGISFTRRSRQV